MKKTEFDDSNTPLSEEEIEGLKPPWIRNRSDLNRAEALNLAKGTFWLMNQAKRVDVFDDIFLCKLHTKLFGEVWKWAGTFRKTNKNIGIDWQEISIQLRAQTQNARFWIDQSRYSAEEMAIRYHYLLVKIHPFPNGNGRWSRTVADYIYKKLYKRIGFKWGRYDLVQKGSNRQHYIDSIREMDRNADPSAMIAFALGN